MQVVPFLEAEQIAHILRAAGTKVLIALGPTEGYDIWEKVRRVRGELPDLKAVLVVSGFGHLIGDLIRLLWPLWIRHRCCSPPLQRFGRKA